MHCVSRAVHGIDIFVYINKQMNALFQNRYRIPSACLQSWNYANAGMYFITICTKNRECYFGEIVVDCRDAMYGVSTLNPTEIGKIAYDEWFRTTQIRPDMNLELGEFIVMPNHIHGIILIGENEYNRDDGRRRDAMHCVSTTEYKNQFAPQSKNIASIIRGYKSAVTTYTRQNGIEFNWQSRFHDHIIRNSK